MNRDYLNYSFDALVCLAFGSHILLRLPMTEIISLRFDAFATFRGSGASFLSNDALNQQKSVIAGLTRNLLKKEMLNQVQHDENKFVQREERNTRSM